MDSRSNADARGVKFPRFGRWSNADFKAFMYYVEIKHQKEQGVLVPVSEKAYESSQDISAGNGNR
jgi:hypothetical protein